MHKKNGAVWVSGGIRGTKMELEENICEMYQQE